MIVEDVLHKEGYSCRYVEGGDDAWREIGIWKPEAAVLDVGLPGMPVFEICDRVRQDPVHRRLGIVLIASVYQRTRYKRSPTSLYGADDYIEKHHLRDSLTLKIARLLPKEDEARSAPGALYPPSVREEAATENKRLPSKKELVKDEAALVREERFGSLEVSDGIAGARVAHLRRFARIIMADIALYNQELVEQGVRDNNLQEVLASEIEEGRRLFEKRLKSKSGEGMQLYAEAIDEFIAGQKARFLSSGGSR